MEEKSRGKVQRKNWRKGVGMRKKRRKKSRGLQLEELS